VHGVCSFIMTLYFLAKKKRRPNYHESSDSEIGKNRKITIKLKGSMSFFSFLPTAQAMYLSEISCH